MQLEFFRNGLTSLSVFGIAGITAEKFLLCVVTMSPDMCSLLCLFSLDLSQNFYLEASVTFVVSMSSEGESAAIASEYSHTQHIDLEGYTYTSHLNTVIRGS